ncbi:hypothetical protein [Streptomyces sp. NPDC005865]|uniref:nSTAND1 domain-containing NTPase n=1 Tax=Streptomyces sp. NPDC005865 TaxID=3155453 RepID=UPI0033EC623B
MSAEHRGERAEIAVGRREKPIDPVTGPVQRFAFELRKLRQEAGSPTYRSMAHESGYSVAALSRAAGGEVLPSLPLTLAYVTVCGGDPADWERRWRTVHEEQVAEPRAMDEESADPPYRGLARFEPGDRARFFGRSRLTDRLTALTRAHRCVVVLGPSGSGKSSLLRAGLIPRLREAEDPTSRPAAIRIFTPGPRPMRDHHQRFVPADGSGDTWLVIDQFEEAFTLCRDSRERREFMDSLWTSQAADSRLRVVLGVRADFYGRLLQHQGLATAVAEAALPVGPMSADELREVIVKPAAADRLIVERALTARLIHETEGEPGALALLSHTLLETWKRRRGRTLTLEGYEAAGGLHGAISQTAEACFIQFSPSQAEEARRILLRLITPGEGVPDTRRPAKRVELGLTESTGRETVLDHLADARLVTLDDDTVELSHEALISAWPRLRNWVDENRERLCRHRRLTDAARNWHDRGRDSGSLLRGAELAEVESLFHITGARAELTAPERDFLDACIASRARARRMRGAVVCVVSLAVVGALIAGVIAWQQNRTSDQRQAESVARRVSAVAQSLRSSEPVLAMRLSLAAGALHESPETRSALLGAMNQSEQDAYRLAGAEDGKAFLSKDGRIAVTADDRTVQMWDVTAHSRTASRPVRGLGPLGDVSPDGRNGVTASGGLTSLQDVRTGKFIGSGVEDRGYYRNSFGPSGRTVLVEDGYGGVRLWDMKDHRLLFKKSRWVQRPSLSPNDRFLALCPRAGGRVQLWDVVKHRELPLRRPQAQLKLACRSRALSFTPDSRGMAVYTSKDLLIWDLASGRVSARIRHRGLDEFEFSPDGKFVAATDGQEILMWRVADPARPVMRFPLADEYATQLRFDTDAGVIRYLSGHGSYDRTVRTLSYGSVMTGKWHKEPATQGTFTPDGRSLGLKRHSGDFSWFEVWRLPEAKRITHTPNLHCREPRERHVRGLCSTTFALSPDGETLAYGRTLFNDDGNRVRESLTLWDMQRQGPAHSITFPRPLPDVGSGEMEGITFSPDGRSLFSLREGFEDIDVWDTSRGTRKRRASKPIAIGYSPPPAAVSPGQVVLRPSGRTLATAGRILSGLPSSATSRTLKMPQPSALAYRSDGGQLAAGGDLGSVVLWDGAVKQRLGALDGTYRPGRPGGAEAVSALAYSPDGKVLAVGGERGTLQLWDIASRQPLGLPYPTRGDAIVALVFASDGRTVVAAGEHTLPQSYAVDSRRATASVCARAGGGPSRVEWQAYLPEFAYRKLC